VHSYSTVVLNSTGCWSNRCREIRVWCAGSISRPFWLWQEDWGSGSTDWKLTERAWVGNYSSPRCEACVQMHTALH